MEELLLTKSYFSHDYDDILCVGGIFSNSDSYCARSVARPGPIRDTIISEVRDLLANISAAPMSTTLDDLYNLATLCLCQSHAPQAHMVASEWNQALRNTRRQHHLSSSPSRNSTDTNMDVQRLQQTIVSLERSLAHKRAAVNAMTAKSKDKERSLLEDTLIWKMGYENLEHDIKVAQQRSAIKINNLEVKISSLKNSLQRDQREISAQRHSLSDLRTANKKLETDVQQSATQLEALRAEHIGANDEAQLLKAKLQQCTTQNQTLQTERMEMNDKIKSLQGNLENLQIKVGNLEKSNKIMAIELTAKDLAMRGEETRVKELMEVISNLEITEVHLKHVIASCWLHRIYNWFTGSRLVF